MIDEKDVSQIETGGAICGACLTLRDQWFKHEWPLVCGYKPGHETPHSWEGLEIPVWMRAEIKQAIDSEISVMMMRDAVRSAEALVDSPQFKPDGDWTTIAHLRDHFRAVLAESRRIYKLIPPPGDKGMVPQKPGIVAYARAFTFVGNGREANISHYRKATEEEWFVEYWNVDKHGLPLKGFKPFVARDYLAARLVAIRFISEGITPYGHRADSSIAPIEEE